LKLDFFLRNENARREVEHFPYSRNVLCNPKRNSPHFTSSA